MDSTAPQPHFVIPVKDRLRQLEETGRFAANIAARRELSAVEARLAPWPSGLHPRLREAAGVLGITALYSHQAEAVGAALRGENVVTVAGTAAGKSLGYLLPILDALLRDERARALLIFPTKALARDQLARLVEWDRALGGGLHPAAYDGDTPAGARSGIRRQARMLVTNPDMLHAGILPHHPGWAAFLGGLTDLVLDELHVYRGVWGSHVANVLRRLRRVADFHQARPRFHFGSATIANPGELAAALAGAPVRVVDEDGAPHGKRTFLIYNPPLVEPQLGIRRSSILEAEALARHFLSGGLQTLVFARSRQAAELMLRYLSENRDSGRTGEGETRPPAVPVAGDTRGERTPSALIGKVRGYRAGYSPAERRAIESDLREGLLRGVVATNALELGIDIGQLDVCVMAGYPGTIASTHQQAGRAGRRGGESVAVLVASASPLDQFIARHPDYLFGRTPEAARIDPDNLLILLDHVRCAAFELPFSDEEAGRSFGDEGKRYDGLDGVEGQAGIRATNRPHGTTTHVETIGSRQATLANEPSDPRSHHASDPSHPAPPAARELLAVLEAQGLLRHVDGRWYWLAEGYPAGSVSLRGAGPGTVAILLGDGEGEDGLAARDSSRVLGTVDRASAIWMLHPGAIYLHEGEPYAVERLDLEAGSAHVHPSDGATYTRASSRVDIRPLDIRDEQVVRGATAFHGELEVRSRVTSYRRLAFRTHEVLGWERLDLPEEHQVAGGYWFRLSDGAVERLRAIGRWKHDPLTGRGADWDRARQEARTRDGFRCRLCNAAEAPDRQHDVHHIRPFRQFGAAAGRGRQGGPPGTGSIDHRAANALDNLITLCPSCHRVAERALGLHGGLSGLGHALGHVAPLFLMCDARDLGVSTESHAAWSGGPTVVVYERASAGVGFGEALFARHGTILTAVRELISDCPCDAGCPACVGPVGEEDREAKDHALAVLAQLLP